MKSKIILTLRWVFLIVAVYQAVHIVIGLANLVQYLNQSGLGAGVGSFMALVALKAIVGLVAWGISIWLKKLLEKMEPQPLADLEVAMTKEKSTIDQTSVESMNVSTTHEVEEECPNQPDKYELSNPSDSRTYPVATTKKNNKEVNALVFIAIILALGFVVILLWPDPDLNWNKMDMTWEHYQEYPPLQISESSYGYGKTRVLRRIYKDESRQVNILLDEEGQFVARFIFNEKCTFESVIETSYRYSNGDPMELVCDYNRKDYSDYLYLGLTWKQKPSKFKLNYSGFNVNEDFTSWDISALERETAALERAAAVKNAKVDNN